MPHELHGHWTDKLNPDRRVDGRVDIRVGVGLLLGLGFERSDSRVG